MPESILVILKLLFLALLYLFFLRVLRAVWLETREPSRASSATGGPARAAAPATMRILAPPERKGEVFTLGEELTVGRAGGCQVSLAEDSTVSQLHARIFHRDGRFYVEDLGSTNGTFVNRKQVSGAVPIRRGDRVQVGQTVLELTR